MFFFFYQGKLSEDVERLTESLRRAEAENKERASKETTSKEEVTSLRQELTAAEARLQAEEEKSEAAVEELRQARQTATAAMEAERDERKKMQEEWENKKEALAAEKLAMQTERESWASTEEQLGRIKEELEAARSRQGTLEADLTELRREAERRSDENDEGLAALKAELEEAQRRSEEMESKCAAWEESATEWQREKGEWEQKVADLTEEVEKNAGMADLKEELQEAQLRVEEMREKGVSMEETVNDLKRENRDLQARVDTLTAEVAEKEDAAVLKGELEETKRSHGEVEEKCARLEKALKAGQEEKRDLEARMAEMTAEADRNAAAATEAAAVHATDTALAAEASKKREEDWQQRLRAMEAEKEALETQLAESTRRENALKLKLNLLRSQARDLFSSDSHTPMKPLLGSDLAAGGLLDFQGGHDEDEVNQEEDGDVLGKKRKIPEDSENPLSPAKKVLVNITNENAPA